MTSAMNNINYTILSRPTVVVFENPVLNYSSTTENSVIGLDKHNRVQPIWVPGYEGTVGNETADQLARTGSEHPFIGPEQACGISVGVAKKAVRDWTNRTHKKKNIGNP
jgi:ribonuclease HI